MEMTPREIQAILDITPDTAENAALIGALQDLMGASRVIKFPFSFTAAFQVAGAANSIAAGAVAAPVNVQISADAPFLWVSSTYDANTANAARASGTFVVPNVRVLLTETGTSRQFMDVPISVPAIFGTGQFPYILPEPRLLQANSQIQVQATNNDAAAGYNLSLYFNGYKLYKQG